MHGDTFMRCGVDKIIYLNLESVDVYIALFTVGVRYWLSQRSTCLHGALAACTGPGAPAAAIRSEMGRAILQKLRARTTLISPLELDNAEKRFRMLRNSSAFFSLYYIPSKH